MAKPAARILFLEAVLGLGAVVILARSFVVQVVEHRQWAARAERREQDRAVPARRGRLFDRNGHPLALSEEQYRASISLNQVQDTAGLQGRLQRDLDLSKASVAAQFRQSFPFFYGPFTAEQVEPLRAVRGVHLEILYSRVYPMQSLADRLLGRLDQNGATGIEGMEKALDTLLQGRAGEEHVLIDGRGHALAVPGALLSPPVAGRDAYLTLDNELQGVAEGALRHAIEADDAKGGDVVIMDVHTGELLAVASIRTDSVTHQLISTPSALVEPNEPGSTSKLFTIAGLLTARADTSPVDGEGGVWMMPIGRGPPRRIRDEHKMSGPVTLGETVKFSSNIAISKFAMRLQPDQQYEAIRSFGFGTPAALGFPGEASGKLRRPALWENDRLSQPSLGQGYEWEATAVQLAAGYGAIANHGVLLAPALVREVRDEHGVVTWRHHPDTVRHAVTDTVAAKLLEYLLLATDSGGTGTKSQLDRIRFPGKTGTAQIKKGGYRASFVGIFPGTNPQAVIYAMIDRPGNGLIYGGDIAAPLVRTILQQALAAAESPFDRSSLTGTVPTTQIARAATVDTTPVHRVTFPLGSVATSNGFSEIPALTGMPAREAVVSLERAGFEVRLVGRSRVRSTSPAAGDSLLRGATVTLYADSVP